MYVVRDVYERCKDRELTQHFPFWRNTTLYWTITKIRVFTLLLCYYGKIVLSYVGESVASLLLPAMAVVWDKLDQQRRLDIHCNSEAIKDVSDQSYIVMFLLHRGRDHNPIEYGNDALELGICGAYHKTPKTSQGGQRTLVE